MEETTEAPLPAAVLSSPPVLISDQDALKNTISELANGTGPFAVDAERASGFKYSARAYLIQVSRRGGGTHLIDPIAVTDLSALAELMANEEWIIHAATQDLSCLREVGLNPTKIFDTELCARLIGLPRVGLATVVADLLGLHLAKEHSAADWSTRPIPSDWLTYAALDVELLPDLRDRLAEKLVETNKAKIAEQEFAALVRWQPAPPREDPWRRLSGIPALTKPRNLAVARELWLARDEFAREIDMGPGRILPDRSILQAAIQLPKTTKELSEMKDFQGRFSRKEIHRWADAIKRGLTTEDLPPMRIRGNSLSAPRNWRERHPDAYARYVCIRAELTDKAESLQIPVENLISPDAVRRLCFDPPAESTVEMISETLEQAGARSWQILEVGELFSACFTEVAANPEKYLAANASPVD